MELMYSSMHPHSLMHSFSKSYSSEQIKKYRIHSFNKKIDLIYNI